MTSTRFVCNKLLTDADMEIGEKFKYRLDRVSCKFFPPFSITVIFNDY